MIRSAVALAILLQACAGAAAEPSSPGSSAIERGSESARELAAALASEELRSQLSLTTATQALKLRTDLDLADIPHVRTRGAVRAPGYTWGQVRTPSSRQRVERDNTILEGAFHQGVDGPEIAPNVRPSVFLQLNYAADSERFDYNNKLRSGVGAQLRYFPVTWAVVEVGVKYEWDYRWVTDRTPSGFVGFVNWSAWREWQGRSVHAAGTSVPLRYIFSTWGQLRYPSSQELAEYRNTIVEGAIEGSVDWWSAGHATLNSFIGLDYKADSQNFDYNNELEPGIGVRLRLRLRPNARAELGGKLVNEYRFRSGESRAGLIAFVGWAANW